MSRKVASVQLLSLLLLSSCSCAWAQESANGSGDDTEDIVLAPGVQIQCTIVDVDDIDGNPKIDGLRCNGVHFVSQHHIRRDEAMCSEASILPPFTEMWWKYLGCALGCILCAAIAAGLTLGLLSLDPWQLKVLRNTNAEDLEPHEQDLLIKNKAHAKTVLPIISGHFFKGSRRASAKIPRCLNPTSNHYLLVTLLLCNSAANEALPLYFDHLLPASLAILVSVSVVLIFGEIVPSAIFTGENKLRLAARLSCLVRVLEFLVFPVAWPLSLALDKCLGHQEDQHNRAELRAIINSMTEADSELLQEESEIMQGVLEMSRRFAQDISKPLKDAKRMSSERVIDEDCIRDLLSWRHSRIIVCRQTSRKDVLSDSGAFDVLGVLPVKRLLGSGLLGQRLGDLRDMFQVPVVLHPNDDLLKVLSMFKKGSCHIALVGSAPDVLAESITKGTSLSPAMRPTMFCSLEDVVMALTHLKHTPQGLARMATSALVTGSRWMHSRALVESDSDEEEGPESGSSSEA